MVKRFAVIGSAVVLAALVLLATLLADPAQPRRQGGGSGLTPQGGTPPLVQIDPKTGLVTSNQVFSQVGPYRATQVNQRGQLIQVFGDTVTPLPKGVLDVVSPGTRIHLTPSRVIEIRAEKGTFVAPDNQPRTGDFHGRVVLTLYDGRPDRRLNLEADSPDIAMRVFLEDARFDLELGQIESDGPVHLTSPKIDFKGRGLSLMYDEPRRRIERLEIVEGTQLRIKASRTADAKANAPAPPADANSQTPVAPADAAPQPVTAAAKDEEGQYYRARLDKQVVINSPELNAEADNLVAYFGIGRRGQTDEVLGINEQEPEPAPAAPTPTPEGAPASAPRPAAAPPGAAVAPAAGTPAASGASGVSAVPAAPDAPRTAGEWPLPPAQTMSPPEPDDVVVTWKGPLLVEPEENPPADMTGLDDVLLQLVGRPVRIVTANKEVVTAAHFDYLASSGRIRLDGSDEFPLVLDSPDLGVVRGPKLVIDQSTGLGQIVGGGSLKAHGEAGLVDAIAPSEKGGQPTNRLPRGMSVTWQDRLDMTFYLRPPSVSAQRSGADDANRIRALKTVTFRGTVDVQHPQFDIRSDLLALGLNDPAEGEQTLDNIQASGGVKLVGRGEGADASDKPMKISSERLSIELARDADGKIQPQRLIAQQNVEVEQPGMRLNTGDLKVGLAVLDEEKGEAGGAASGATANASGVHALADGNGSRISIRNMVAEDGVRIVTDDPMTIDAQRLVGDTAADQIEIFGTPQKPAQIQREDGLLVGEHIVIGQTTRNVNVLGAGRFQFVSRGAAAPAGEGEAERGEGDRLKPADGSTIEVTWVESMLYDDLAGFARFIGGVKMNSRSGNDLTRLDANDLKLKFVSLPAERDARGDAPPKPSDAGPNALLGSRDGGDRAIHSVTAEGDVRFEAANWADQPGGKLATRITISGPVMTFEEPHEEVQVVGQGQMLFEDYRPESEPGAGAAAEASTAPGSASRVRFTGRGATLFTWHGRLILDAFHNDMTIQDRVQMVHRPSGGQDVMQLDCQNLLADLEATGGLGVWRSSKAPHPAVKIIRADRDVRLLADGKTILGDHLQYTGTDQLIVLRAAPGKMIDITDLSDPRTHSVREIRWDLAKDRIHFEDPTPGQMPIQ